jgi:hypothetical protein
MDDILAERIADATNISQSVAFTPRMTEAFADADDFQRLQLNDELMHDLEANALLRPAEAGFSSAGEFPCPMTIEWQSQ